MSRTFLALAPRTSWPWSSKILLTHGEWVLASMATRIGSAPEKRLSKASRFVAIRLSSIISPFSVSIRHR
jgi:hypothetical protein